MIDKLIAKIQKTGAPIVVGLDPMLNYIPEHIQKKAFAEYGETLEGAAEAIWQFNKEIVDKTYDLIPAVKPQIAMYEQFGIEGLKAYKKTIDYCKSKDLVVIGDIKRGDIGSTSAAYAVGHLGKVQVGSKCYVPFDEDFATVNPYLGSDGVKPFIEVCKEENKGLFILVKTSNPSSGEFQDQLVNGRPLYELVGEKVAQWGEEHVGQSGYSYIGAVVGAGELLERGRSGSHCQLLQRHHCRIQAGEVRKIRRGKLRRRFPHGGGRHGSRHQRRTERTIGEGYEISGNSAY